MTEGEGEGAVGPMGARAHGGRRRRRCWAAPDQATTSRAPLARRAATCGSTCSRDPYPTRRPSARGRSLGIRQGTRVSSRWANPCGPQIERYQPHAGTSRFISAWARRGSPSIRGTSGRGWPHRRGRPPRFGEGDQVDGIVPARLFRLTAALRSHGARCGGRSGLYTLEVAVDLDAEMAASDRVAGVRPRCQPPRPCFAVDRDQRPGTASGQWSLHVTPTATMDET